MSKITHFGTQNDLQNQSQINFGVPFGDPGVDPGASWPHFLTPWDLFWTSWGSFWEPGVALGCPWGLLWRSWGQFGCALGLLFNVLGSLLEVMGSNLEFRVLFWMSSTKRSNRTQHRLWVGGTSRRLYNNPLS